MKWKKLGRIFNPTEVNDGIEREWMKEFSQCTSTLVFDTLVFNILVFNILVLGELFFDFETILFVFVFIFDDSDES